MGIMRAAAGVLVALSAWLVAAGAGTGAQSTAPPPAAAEFARRLQAHYDTVRDFTADFTHQYRGGVLRQTQTERGKVRVKKPGRMDWTYTAPEKKQFVSDGRKMYSYVANDNVVRIYDLPEDSTALQFLAGKGSLVRDFRAAVPAEQPAGAWQLNLTPTAVQAEYTYLTLTVDPRTLAFRGLTSTDPQGGVSTFQFTNLKENVGLTDRQFAFKIPRGAEVQQ